MKTNKSFKKRLKVTKRGKLVARRPGQNHFNAKEAQSGRMARKRKASFSLNSKLVSKFMPHSGVVAS